MADDLRIKFGFFEHPKTKRLLHEHGPLAVFCLMKLWAFAGQYRTKGNLTGMNASDIALAAGWEGEADKFVGCLFETGFLKTFRKGTYRLNDWAEHQSYLFFSKERSLKAKKAAAARHNKTGNTNTSSKTNRESQKLRVKLPVQKQNGKNAANAKPPNGDKELAPAKSTTEHVNFSAPSPTPSPDPFPPPSPEPSPSPEPKEKSIGALSEHRIAVEYFCQEYERKLGIKYGFSAGKDGQLIKTLLGRFGVGRLKKLIDEIMTTDDEWIANAGITIPILSSQANKLAQAIVKRKNPSLLDQLSPAGRRTALAGRELLRELEGENE